MKPDRIEAGMGDLLRDVADAGATAELQDARAAAIARSAIERLRDEPDGSTFAGIPRDEALLILELHLRDPAGLAERFRLGYRRTIAGIAAGELDVSDERDAA